MVDCVSRRISRGKRTHLMICCDVMINTLCGIRALLAKERYPGEFVNPAFVRQFMGRRLKDLE